MIHKTKIYVTTTGTAAAAVGSGVSEQDIMGRVVRVDVAYHASAPATTNLTLVQTHEAVAATIVTLATQNTSKTLYPHVQMTTNAGVGLTLDGTRLLTDFYVCCDTLTASITGSNALTNCAVLDVYWED
jgi:hypothetical protein